MTLFLFIWYFLVRYDTHLFYNIHTIHSSVAIRRGSSSSPHRWSAQWEKPPLGCLCEIRTRACLTASQCTTIWATRTLEKKMRFLPVHFQLAFHEGVMTDEPSLPNLISSEFLSWKTNQQNKIRISPRGEHISRHLHNMRPWGTCSCLGTRWFCQQG